MSPDIADAPSIEAMIRAGAAALGNSRSPRLDARILARLVLNTDEAGLIAKAGDAVTDSEKAAFADLIFRRAAGEPIAYIVGEKEFWGLPFKVGPGVLIPRPDSECLIDAILARRDRGAALRILDLGTGSGALICALINEFPLARGVAIDVSPAALDFARANVETHGFEQRIRVRQSDWFEAVDGVFDVIIANAPYIPEKDRAELMLDVSEFEPDRALFAGADGLDAYRTIIANAPSHITAGGMLVMEYGTPGQGEAIRAMLVETAPTGKMDIIRDLAARERGVIAQFPGNSGD